MNLQQWPKNSKKRLWQLRQQFCKSMRLLNKIKSIIRKNKILWQTELAKRTRKLLNSMLVDNSLQHLKVHFKKQKDQCLQQCFLDNSIQELKIKLEGTII